MYYAVQREDAVLFDARLSDLAHTLLAFADHEIRELEADGAAMPERFESDATMHGRYSYQIWSRQGRLMLASANAPRAAPLVPLAELGWSRRMIDGQAFRVFALENAAGDYRIQAAEPVATRLELSSLFGRYLMVGLPLSAAALSALTLLLLATVLRPLRSTAAQIAERGPGDLRAVGRHSLPEEFEPVLDAVNRLLQRIDVAMRSEREFVAAAAHELRTPLAGLRAQAQLAAHPRTSGDARTAALQLVQESVDHAAHLVNQLLDLARSDALAGDALRPLAASSVVELRGAFVRAMTELGSTAALRGLRIRQDFGVERLRGSDFGITLILRNLLDNAIAHAPVGGVVAVGTAQDGPSVLLWVEDSGPGVAPAERERVLERFHRGKGVEHPGCGLGLSIVKSLADAHGATLTLGESTLGGLRVTLRFPS